MRREERQYLIWEFVRRNDDYGKDFEKYGGKNLEGSVANAMLEKWRTFGRLPNPKDPLDLKNSLYDYPDLASPVSGSRFGSVFWDDRIELFEPGSALKRKGRIVKKFQKWTVFKYKEGTFEALNKDNCPVTLTITLLIDPSHPKITEVKKVLEKEFNKAYQRLSAAQREVFRSVSPRARLKEFKKYLRVWDLKEEGNRTWLEIAREVLPKYFEGKTEEPVVARDLVRYYYKQAEKMINGGWMEI